MTANVILPGDFLFYFFDRVHNFFRKYLNALVASNLARIITKSLQLWRYEY
jgi:hypothetical protein